MVAGPEAETSGSKLPQAGKEKRKGGGVANGAKYGQHHSQETLQQGAELAKSHLGTPGSFNSQIY